MKTYFNKNIFNISETNKSAYKYFQQIKTHVIFYGYQVSKIAIIIKCQFKYIN